MAARFLQWAFPWLPQPKLFALLVLGSVGVYCCIQLVKAALVVLRELQGSDEDDIIHPTDIPVAAWVWVGVWSLLALVFMSAITEEGIRVFREVSQQEH